MELYMAVVGTFVLFVLLFVLLELVVLLQRLERWSYDVTRPGGEGSGHSRDGRARERPR